MKHFNFRKKAAGGCYFLATLACAFFLWNSNTQIIHATEPTQPVVISPTDAPEPSAEPTPVPTVEVTPNPSDTPDITEAPTATQNRFIP